MDELQNHQIEQQDADEAQWWDEQVEALLEKAEARYAGSNQDEGYNDRCLNNLRMLIDTAVDNLQHYALHNPCGDNEVVELEGGIEACAGCFNEDGSAKE